MSQTDDDRLAALLAKKKFTDDEAHEDRKAAQTRHDAIPAAWDEIESMLLDGAREINSKLKDAHMAVRRLHRTKDSSHQYENEFIIEGVEHEIKCRVILRDDGTIAVNYSEKNDETGQIVVRATDVTPEWCRERFTDLVEIALG